jgi:ketosteroid isomerase-like protein
MDLAAERSLLLQRDAEWAAAASEGLDLERVLSYWTDDAIFMPPGLPAVIGKAALRGYVRASMNMPGFPDQLDLDRRNLFTGCKLSLHVQHELD